MRVLLEAVGRRQGDSEESLAVARELIAEYRAQGKRVPGYGHRIHSDDPRSRRLFALAQETGVAGEHVEMAHALGQALAESLGKALPINVDGSIAALLCDMGFPPEIGNGIFAIARAVGLTAHVFDEITQQRPMRYISPNAHKYSGPPDRSL
jgi:citrate synthase